MELLQMIFCQKEMNMRSPVLKICFGPPTAESKNLKNHVNFDVGDLFFRSPALWSSQNVFGPPTAGRVVVDFKDRAPEPPHKSFSPGTGCRPCFTTINSPIIFFQWSVSIASWFFRPCSAFFTGLLP